MRSFDVVQAEANPWPDNKKPFKSYRATASNGTGTGTGTGTDWTSSYSAYSGTSPPHSRGVELGSPTTRSTSFKHYDDDPLSLFMAVSSRSVATAAMMPDDLHTLLL